MAATSDWIAEPLPPREHLLVDERTGRGAMDRIGVWLMGGAGGAGKSYALLALALALISDSLWLDTFRPARIGRVLIIAAEDSIEDIRRRVHAIAAALGIPSESIVRLHVLAIHDRVTALVVEQAGTYVPSPDTKSLCDQLTASEPYDLVIVDPYGRIAGVSVDADNAAAAATITALASIATAARGLVLGVTHTSLRARIGAANGSPEGATGIRGATGQTDYARGVLRLERDGELLALSLAKANHVAPWEPVALRRGDRGELYAVPKDELPRPVDRAAEKEAARRERDRLDDVAAREAIGANPGASVRTLRALVKASRACGTERADNAIERVRNAAATAEVNHDG
ncbi:MAG: AAA family ATPase [Kofleriaceae bacterium]